MLLFDAHIFCTVNTEPKADANNEDEDDEAKKPKGILASLHYFNSQDLTFSDIETYFITANVSLSTSHHLESTFTTPTDCQGS